MKPRAIDIFCGLGGWTEGFLAEGYDVVGFDNERHRYPARELPDSEAVKGMHGSNGNGTSHMNYENEKRLRNSPLTGGWHEYPAQLVLQDVLTIHGKQFKDAAVIVASPPCQEYSYMAMPWKRGKQIGTALRSDLGPVRLPFPEGYDGSRSIFELNALFNACFRIQREACEAAGRYIPMVVENVKGAQPWVGQAKAHFGSFYLWGDVGMVGNRVVAGGLDFGRVVAPMGRAAKVPGFRSDGSGGSFQTAAVEGTKIHALSGPNQRDDAAGSADCLAGIVHDQSGTPSAPIVLSGVESPDSFGWSRTSALRNNSSKSPARKAASAQIAKIPLALSIYIARAFRPKA